MNIPYKMPVYRYEMPVYQYEMPVYRKLTILKRPAGVCYKSRIIRVMAVMLFVFVCGYGCNNDETGIEPENQIIKLIGPSAYKGLENKMVVEGFVENNSDRTLKNVMVIVSWYKEDKDFLTSKEAACDKGTLLPHETSTYRLESKFDIRMDNYSVEFYNEKEEQLSVYRFHYNKP